MLFSLAAGCGEGQQGGKDAGDIIIASANPMTGDSAQFGDMKVKAIKLAIEEVNAAGGIDGRQVKLQVEDDIGNPKEAPNVAQKIASNPNVLAVIGHWNSSCTLAAREIYESAGIPVITDSVNKQITDGKTPHVFRISLTDTHQAYQLAEYAYNKLGVRKVAVIYTANDFGMGLNNDFTKKFKELGGTVTASETYFEGQTKDFKAQLTKIKKTNPELLFMAGYYTECALIAKQMKEIGFNIPILGTEGISSEQLIKLGGDAVEGIRFTGFFHPDVEFPGTKEFVAKFKEKYGVEPDTYAALAYDSAKMILEGIKTNGATREGVYKYLREVKDFPGVAGPITFDSRGENNRSIIILTVKNGKFVPDELQP
ncbi:MAG: penicillin-binding protein activator [Thermosyntropha sp.]|nr:penicillin-binding protein activator [Thermosyntropha sp.]